MPFDENLAERVRRAMAAYSERVEEKRMFGGVAFMYGGHMSCGIVKSELMVRVGPEAYEETLRLPNCRAMDFTGRPMKGFVFVEEEGCADEAALAEWVGRGVRYAERLGRT